MLRVPTLIINIQLRLHRPASLDSNVFSSVKKGDELLKHPVVARGFWKRQRSTFFDGRD